MTPLSGAVGGCRLEGARVICLLLAFSLFISPARGQSSARRGTFDLTLEDYVKRVVSYNESVQERLLELEINRRKYKAEYGVFEPELVGSFSRESNKRENTVEQQHTTPT